MSVARLVLLVVKLCVFVLLSAIAMNDLIAAKVFLKDKSFVVSVNLLGRLHMRFILYS